MSPSPPVGAGTGLPPASSPFPQGQGGLSERHIFDASVFSVPMGHLTKIHRVFISTWL